MARERYARPGLQSGCESHGRPDTPMEDSVVVGHAVNGAGRVPDLTKQVGAAILVSDTTAASLEAQFHFGAQAVLAVRGKAKAIRVMAVVTPISSATRDISCWRPIFRPHELAIPPPTHVTGSRTRKVVPSPFVLST